MSGGRIDRPKDRVYGRHVAQMTQTPRDRQRRTRRRHHRGTQDQGTAPSTWGSKAAGIDRCNSSDCPPCSSACCELYVPRHSELSIVGSHQTESAVAW